MRILKKGRKFGLEKRKFTCGICGCVFVAKQKEGIESLYGQTVRCP